MSYAKILPGGRMNKALILSALFLCACAHQAQKPKSSIAQSSMANGLITATAEKKLIKNNVCFDINLKMKGVKQNVAAVSNWTAAWVDEESRYYLLNLRHRVPASTPRKMTDGWENNFITCVPHVSSEKINNLILTPKTLPYKEAEGMTLEWK